MKNAAIAVILAAAAGGFVNRQPVVAVGGAYGLMTATVATPSGDCPDDCGCGGTGVVGDGRIEIDCGCPSDCSCKQKKAEPPKAEPPKMRKLYRMPGPTWNWEGVGNPSESFMRLHMMQDHGIDATGWSKKAMQVGHDNLHNGYDVWGEEPASAGTFRSDCPSGNCPTSSPRRSLFGRRR